MHSTVGWLKRVINGDSAKNAASQLPDRIASRYSLDVALPLARTSLRDSLEKAGRFCRRRAGMPSGYLAEFLHRLIIALHSTLLHTQFMENLAKAR